MALLVAISATASALSISIQRVYSGALGSSWSDDSLGCNCDYEDQTHKRPGAVAALHAEIEPWGRSRLYSSKPFGGNSVMDMWIKGEHATRGALKLRNSEYLTESDMLIIGESTTENVRVISGPDADGWLHIQVFLTSLTRDITATTELPNEWDEIVLLDLTGQGMVVTMDEIWLVEVKFNGKAEELDGLAASIGISSSDDELLPPVIGAESVLEAEESDRWILRVRPGTLNRDVDEICEEGRDAGQSGDFDCVATPAAIVASSNESPDDEAFEFVTIKAASDADIEVIQQKYKDQLVYIERDLTATAHLFEEGFQGDAASSFATLPWGLDRLDEQSLPLDGVYAPGDQLGAGAHVYVLDTGCRATHAEFAGRVGDSVSMVSNTSFDGASSGHGTHVSGTVLGWNYGVAKEATLHCVKVLSDSGSGSYSAIINGMRWVSDHAKNNGIQAAVVNMSLGGPRSTSLNDAVESLVRSGITVVVSAGNENSDACNVSPASAPSAVTVGSTTRNDFRSSFSNWGNCLDIWAPGSDILSASNSSDTGTRVLSGTSMAGPHVAGAAALYLAAAPGSSPAKVASALSDAALRIGFDSRSPSRLLNVQRLVPAPAPATPAPTTPAPTDPATPAPTDRATPAPTDRATPAPTSGPTPPAPGPTPPPSYGPRPIIIPGWS